jgi:hypothetical protein
MFELDLDLNDDDSNDESELFDEMDDCDDEAIEEPLTPVTLANDSLSAFVMS